MLKLLNSLAIEQIVVRADSGNPGHALKFEKSALSVLVKKSYYYVLPTILVFLATTGPAIASGLGSSRG